MDFVDTNIIITEPYFNFTSIQESMNEILFEEYQFQAVLRVNGMSPSSLHLCILKLNSLNKELASTHAHTHIYIVKKYYFSCFLALE